MSDSDSDDIPLALLGKKKAAAAAVRTPPADDPEEESSEEEEFDDGDDDDDEDFEGGGEVSEDGDDEVDAKYYSSDSSDDVPLSSLKSPKKKKAAASAKKSPTKKKKAASAKKAPAKKTTKAKTKTDTKAKKKKAAKKPSSSGKKSPVPSGKSSAAAGRPNLPSFALNDKELDKGLLIQRFLCRWWYAVEWPDPSSLPSKPPAGYDALNGFPGVYIRTEGASIGKIVDRRDKSTAPSFANCVRKSSEELQGLLLTALAKQKEQLVKAEGHGTATEKELDRIEKWTRKLNCKKLDKDAATAMRAAGISLD
jgi:hypothetical protein